MKRTTALCMIFILFSFCCMAQEKEMTAEYSYANALIQTLNLCEQAMSTQYKDEDSPDLVAEKMKAQNMMLERAKTEIGPYLMQGDAAQKNSADLLTDIIDGQIDLNDRQLALYDKYRNQDSSFSYDLDAQLAREDTAKSPWVGILSISKSILLPLYEVPEKYRAKAKVEFRISKAERKQLTDDIDRAFGEDMQTYLKDPDGEDNGLSDGQDNILHAVGRIKRALQATTWQELNKSNNW